VWTFPDVSKDRGAFVFTGQANKNFLGHLTLEDEGISFETSVTTDPAALRHVSGELGPWQHRRESPEVAKRGTFQ